MTVEVNFSESEGVEVEVSDSNISDLQIRIGDLFVIVDDDQARRLYEGLGEWFGPAPEEGDETVMVPISMQDGPTKA